MNLEALKAELTRDEGVRLRPYRDSEGYLTIGIGHNLDTTLISVAAVQQMLQDDILDKMGDLNRELPWWTKLDDVRQRVLMNMCFMGIQKLLKFKKMLAAAEAGDYDKAADEILDSKYAKQVGARATRLAQMMRTGLS